jgi:hypothetical protein
MAEPEIPLLTDREIYPSPEVIFSIIGENESFWHKIMDYAHSKYDNVTGEWRYYNDGKRWLFKLSRKKKTVFWLGLVTGTFRITFYFPDKAETSIADSDLPERIKDGFIHAKRFGTLRAISSRIEGEQDVENILKLIDLKVKMK